MELSRVDGTPGGRARLQRLQNLLRRILILYHSTGMDDTQRTRQHGGDQERSDVVLPSQWAAALTDHCPLSPSP